MVNSVDVGVNLDIQIGFDVQIVNGIKVTLAVNNLISVDLGLGFNLGHKLIGVVVASLDVEVLDIDISSSVNKLVFVVVIVVVRRVFSTTVGETVITASNA
jgi:hypothetical protein